MVSVGPPSAAPVDHSAGVGPATRLRPLGIGEMVDAAIKVYRSRPKQMIVASVVLVLPAIVLLTLVQLSAGDPQELTKTDVATGLPTLDLDETLIYLGGVLASTIILLLANNLAVAATTRMSMSAYLGEDVNWRESLRFAFRRFRPLTGLLLISTVGYIVGFALCIAPAIWLSGIWAVAVPVLLVEDLGPVASLGRSSQLVRGRFWPVLGAIVVGSLLASLVQGAFVAPVIILQFVGASFLVTSLLNGAAQLVAVSVTVPFVAALTAVIYVDLRVRKEGFDLQLLARGVGLDPAGDDPRAGPLGSIVAPAPDDPRRGSDPLGPLMPVAPPGGWGTPQIPTGGWGTAPGDPSVHPGDRAPGAGG